MQQKREDVPRLGCSTWFAVRFTPQNPEEIWMQYKRLLAGILSLAMLCSMASTPAYAVEDAVQSDNTAVVSEEQNPETDIGPGEVTVLSDQGGTGGTDGLDTDAPVIVTLKNNTLPQLQINITLREPDAENGGYAETTLNGVQFEVYYKDGGAFAPVKNAGGERPGGVCRSGPVRRVCGGHRRYAQDRDAERQNPCRNPGNVPELQSGSPDPDQTGEPGPSGSCRAHKTDCGSPPVMLYWK